jgi:hypothetical protein
MKIKDFLNSFIPPMGGAVILIRQLKFDKEVRRWKGK